MAGSAVELATAYVSISSSTKGLGKQIAQTFGDQPMGKVGESAGRSITSRLGGVLKKGALGVGAAAGGVLATSLFKGWNRLTNIENATAKLTGLGHSAGTVKGIMDNALKSVKGTAFGLDEAATIAAGAVAAGIKPGKELQRILGLTGDAATIAGVSMGEMGQVFNKVASSNKIQGDVINQLNDKGIPIVQLLAKTMGKTSAEVTALASKGKVDFPTFAKAMEQGLGGAALKSGETTQGAFKNMGAAMGRFGATLLKGVFPVAKKVFGGVTTLFDRMGNKVGPVVEKMSGALVGLFDLFGKGDYTANLGKALGVEEDSALVDRLLRVREGVQGIFDFAVKGDFTGNLGSALGVEEDSALVDKLFTIRDAVTKDFWAGLSMDKGTRAEFEGSLDGAVGFGAKLRAVFDGVLDVAKALWPSVVSIGTALLAASQQLGVSSWSILQTALDLAARALEGMVPLLESVAKWLSENEKFVQGLALGFVAYRTALFAAAVVTTAMSTATKVWTGAQKLLNMVMNASPIGRVVQIIALLVGAFIVAYNTSDTFRRVVDRAMAGIKKAAAAAFGWIVNTAVPWLQSAWTAIGNGLKAVGGFFSSVWSGITSAVKSAWGFISGVLNSIVGFLANAFGPALRTYQAIWKAVFTAIQILVLAAWKLVIKPTFDSIKNGLRGVGDFFQWIYNRAIKPAWDAVGAAIKWVWDRTVAPVFNAIKTGAGWVADKFKSVGKLIASAWEALKSPLQAVWEWIDEKVFSAIKTGVDLVKSAFETAKNGIKTVWDSLKDIAKAPIKFIIETVLNGGLIKGFNWLAEKIGGPKIDDIPLPFKAGGVLPGYTPGRDVHQFYSPTGGRLALSGGEAIMRPEFTRLVGGESGVARLNAMARGGSVPFQRFKDGGVLDWIKSKASSAFDWMRDKSGAIWQALSDPAAFFASKIPAMDAARTIGQYGEATVVKAKDMAVGKIKGLWDAFKGAFAQSDVAAAAPGGLPGDARGLTLGGGVRLDQDTINRILPAAAQYAMRVVQGSWSHARLSMGTHAGAGAADIVANNWHGAVAALRAQGLLAMFRNWPGNQHIHALNPNVGGLSPEALAQVRRARANNGIFADGGVVKPLLFDSGGVLPMGDSWVRNNTGRPEPLARVDRMGGDIYVQNPFTGEYLLARVADVASDVVDDNMAAAGRRAYA